MAGESIGLLLVLTYSAVPPGTLSVTEGTDTAAFNGSVTAVPVGALVTTESPDIASFAGAWKAPKATPLYPSEWDYGWYRGHPPIDRYGKY